MNDPKLHRYMAYLKNEGFGPKDARLLLSNARQIVEKYDILIRDVRVSNRFIEFDISLGNIEDLEKIRSIFSFIGQYIDRYKVVEKDLKIEESLILAKKLFNEEKYWITHEVTRRCMEKSLWGRERFTKWTHSCCCRIRTLSKKRKRYCSLYYEKSAKEVNDSK